MNLVAKLKNILSKIFYRMVHLMIIGIGTDIIEIERVINACAANNFTEKYFTESERQLLAEKKPETAAGSFCCKEAAAKALGCGFRFFSTKCVEILRNESGAPVVNLHGAAKETADKLGVTRIHASISHCGTYAAAFVIMEG